MHLRVDLPLKELRIQMLQRLLSRLLHLLKFETVFCPKPGRIDLLENKSQGEMSAFGVLEFYRKNR